MAIVLSNIRNIEPDFKCIKCLIKRPSEELNIDLICDVCIESTKKKINYNESLNIFAKRLYHFGSREL